MAVPGNSPNISHPIAVVFLLETRINTAVSSNGQLAATSYAYTAHGGDSAHVTFTVHQAEQPNPGDSPSRAARWGCALPPSWSRPHL